MLGFLIGNACARILQGLDSTPRAPLSRWLDRTLQKIKDKVVPDVLNNFSIKEENIRMISVSMNKIPRNKMLQKNLQVQNTFSQLHRLVSTLPEERSEKDLSAVDFIQNTQVFLVCNLIWVGLVFKCFHIVVEIKFSTFVD